MIIRFNPICIPGRGRAQASCSVGAFARRRPAFTLTEILVAIAIIVALAAGLIPVVSGALERARGVRSIKNIQNVILIHRTCASENHDEIVPGSGSEKGRAKYGFNAPWTVIFEREGYAENRDEDAALFWTGR
jgi:prepilin-type N-terminal cleavage/methylation domain-containing protein